MFNSVFRAVHFNYPMKKKIYQCSASNGCIARSKKWRMKEKEKKEEKKQALLNQEQDENAQGNRRREKDALETTPLEPRCLRSFQAGRPRWRRISGPPLLTAKSTKQKKAQSVCSTSTFLLQTDCSNHGNRETWVRRKNKKAERYVCEWESLADTKGCGGGGGGGGATAEASDCKCSAGSVLISRLQNVNRRRCFTPPLIRAR